MTEYSFNEGEKNNVRERKNKLNEETAWDGRCAKSALINDDGLLVLIFIIIHHLLFAVGVAKQMRERERERVKHRNLFIYFP